QKSTCGFGWVALEPPSPAALRRTTGRQTGGTDKRLNGLLRGGDGKFEVDLGGRAVKFRAQRSGFCLLLFDIVGI
ncbi:hypothetical protein ATO10_15727, partial [Actibacterium atlanticum]